MNYDDFSNNQPMVIKFSLKLWEKFFSASNLVYYKEENYEGSFQKQFCYHFSGVTPLTIGRDVRRVTMLTNIAAIQFP